MPSTGDLMEDFVDFGEIDLRDCIEGLDDEQTLNPAALSHAKGLSANHDFIGDNDTREKTPFLLEESYQEDSQSDSSSSKRASSEASSSKSSGTSGELMADGLGNGHAKRPPVGPFDGGFSSNPHSPVPMRMDTSFGGDAYDHDDFMNDFIKSGSPEGMETGESSPEADIFDNFGARETGNGVRQRPNGHAKNESNASFMSTAAMSPHSATFLQSPAMASNTPSPGNFDFGSEQTRGQNGAALWANQMMSMGGGLPPTFGTQQPSQGFSMPDGLFQLPMFNTLPSAPAGPPRLTFSNDGMPAKIRVETQIRLKMTLSHIPMGITKLHLPHHAISKPKLWAKPHHEPSSETLELHTMLVCTSAMANSEAKERALKRARDGPNAGTLTKRPEIDEKHASDKPQNGGEVWICTNCMEREKKRSQRKRNKKPEEDKMWELDEWRRVVIFNTQELRDFPKPDSASGAITMELPMRLACYCRHQHEKTGYQVIFTLRDWRGNVIVQELTPSIMISDDHKTHPVRTSQGASAAASSGTTASGQASEVPTRDATPAASTAAPSVSLTQPAPFRASQSVSDLSKYQSTSHAHPTRVGTGTTARSAALGRGLSRPASPTNPSSAPHAKKRKSSSGKIPASMTMTPLDTTTLSSPSGPLVASQSAATSPFPQSSVTFASQDTIFTGRSPGATSRDFGTAPTTPSIEHPGFFSPTHVQRGSLDGFALPPQFPVNTSAHGSRAPSPSSFGNAMNAAMAPQLSQMLQNGSTNGLGMMNGFGSSMLGETGQPPTITKINPASGSKSGGYEVTILGSGFNRSLEVMFGDRKATTTTFWAQNTLICMVPPYPVKGDVALSFHQIQPGYQSMLQPTKFTYVDDEEDKICNQAIRVLARKMAGEFVDVKTFAMSILSNQTQSGQHGGDGTVDGPGGSNFNTAAGDREQQLLKCLELVDLDDSPYKPQWDLRTSSGQTMLHLACSLGYHRFAAGLLARGASYDVRDNGGYTPMHLAALNDRPEIVRRLLLYGADPTLKSISGETAADVADSDCIMKELRRVTKHRRTQSARSVPVTALHSAASSTTSLKSLWGNTPALQDANRALEDEYGEGSYEYSTSDYEDSEEDDDDILQMRRPAMHRRTTSDHTQLDADLPLSALPASPSAAAAVARSFHQFQQAMTEYLGPLPQLPPMPQMPAFAAMGPTLTEMRRLASLMPGMSDARPGSSADSDSERFMSGWRQNLWPSFMNDNTAPPPAYEDIFPDADDQSNRKPRSAAEARAMQQQRPTDLKRAPSASAADGAEYGVLTIGSKNAITKEQQDMLLREHEARFKRLSRDRNLFFIWIPLLVCMLCALLYRSFPGAVAFVSNFLRSFLKIDRPVEAVTRGAERFRKQLVE